MMAPRRRARTELLIPNQTRTRGHTRFTHDLHCRGGEVSLQRTTSSRSDRRLKYYFLFSVSLAHSTHCRIHRIRTAKTATKSHDRRRRRRHDGAKVIRVVAIPHLGRSTSRRQEGLIIEQATVKARKDSARHTPTRRPSTNGRHRTIGDF